MAHNSTTQPVHSSVFLLETLLINTYQKMLKFLAVGFRFHDSTPETLLEPNVQIELRLEDQNPVDSQAVGVYVGGKLVAYVARDYCAQVRDLLAQGPCTVSPIARHPQSVSCMLTPSPAQTTIAPTAAEA